MAQTKKTLHGEDLTNTTDLSSIKKGRRLMQWLMAEARRRNLTFQDLAKILGVSRSYLYALRYGQRQIDGLAREILVSCANFLNVPMISVLMAAEIVMPQDFYQGSPETFQHDLDRALEFIQNDGDWGAMLPESKDLSQKTKIFVVLAYQDATGKTLLDKKINVEEEIRRLDNPQ